MAGEGDGVMVESARPGSISPAARLAGMMTAKVKSMPAQNARMAAPTMAPMIAATLDLDFIYHLSHAPADVNAVATRTTTNTPSSTRSKIIVKSSIGLEATAGSTTGDLPT